MNETPEDWRPGPDTEDGAGPSGDLETETPRTESEPGAEEPVPEGGQGAAGAGGPSPERPEHRGH